MLANSNTITIAGVILFVMTVGAVIEYLATKENIDDTSGRTVLVVSIDKQVK